MASGGQNEEEKQSPGTPSLSEQTHKQVLDYLQLAENSKYPTIRKAAIEIAKQTSRYQRKQGARLSPTLLLSVAVGCGVVVALATWYAYLHYSDTRAAHLASLLMRVYLFTMLLMVLISGHLSQENFMKILSWLKDHLWPFKSADPQQGSQHGEGSRDDPEDNSPG